MLEDKPCSDLNDLVLQQPAGLLFSHQPLPGKKTYQTSDYTVNLGLVSNIKIHTGHTYENKYLIRDGKELAKPQSKIPNIYFRKGKEITNSKDHLCTSNLEI